MDVDARLMLMMEDLRPPLPPPPPPPEPPAAAVVAEPRPSHQQRLKSPHSLYNYCLRSYVRNLYQRDQRHEDEESDPKQNIRFLPPFVLIDILHAMSKDKRAHQVFRHELHDMQLLGKLLRSGSSRQKLFKCLATVTQAQRDCVRSIADEFVRYVDRRYPFVGGHRQVLSQPVGTPRPLAKSPQPPVLSSPPTPTSPVQLRRLSSHKRRTLNYPYFHCEHQDRQEQDQADEGDGVFPLNDGQPYDEHDETLEDYFYRYEVPVIVPAPPAPVVSPKRRSPYILNVLRLVQGGGGSGGNSGNSGNSGNNSAGGGEQKESQGEETEKESKPNLRDEVKLSDSVWEREVFVGLGFNSQHTFRKRDSFVTALDLELLRLKEIEAGLKKEDDILQNLMDGSEIIYLVKQAPYRLTIDMGMQIGAFLVEAGWLEDGISVFEKTLSMIQCLGESYYADVLLRLECLHRILNGQSRFCMFTQAHRTAATINEQLAVVLAKDTQKLPPAALLAMICKERALMHYVRSEYQQSYEWSVQSLQLLGHGQEGSGMSDRIRIECLLQAGKSCVVKRQYKRANLLITLAVRRAKAKYGRKHQRYADALLDYGFYLLNVDLINDSVDVYNEALDIKRTIFGDMNLYVGIAHEDLAYALYVKEYSSGEFYPARDHIEKALTVMRRLVPGNHLMLASASRVKALILEEIALDNTNVPHYEELLQQSESLHESALELSLAAFGEINVQTAKHYGNLGRLYQSMMKFEAAEQMHKRAIKIKTDLLGAYDYEVGLSIGHLASLYNYQMQKHREAEELYKKSIDISLLLFGATYSGLEYDYRGLCHIYDQLGDVDRYLEYSRILENWRNLRIINEEAHVNQLELVEIEDDEQMEEVIRKFFILGVEVPAGVTAGPVVAKTDDQDASNSNLS